MAVRDAVRIRDLVVERGARHRALLKVGEIGAGPVELPVVVIHGARPGPTLCLTGGVHATEYPGQTAVRELSRQLDPAALSGTVIAVPVLFDVSGSGVVLVTDAEFAMIDPFGIAALVLKTNVSVALLSAARVADVHVIVPLPPTDGVVQFHPAGAVAETKVVLAGMVSVIVRLWAGLGPRFST